MIDRCARVTVVLSLTLAAVLATTGLVRADSVLPVDTLKEWCSAKADDGTNRRYLCIFYMRGVLDGVVIQSAMTKGKPIFCVTDKSNFEYSALPDFFNTYVSEHPASERTEMAGVAFARALVARMPCK